jgi:5-methylcytosine-specific restriction protein A
VPATEVDHKKAHHGDQGLFWDRYNWQALCKPCHSRKTAEEDHRWGN